VVLLDVIVEMLDPPQLAAERQDFLLTEAANAPGYEACFSVPTVKGSRRRSALINFLRKRFAAETARLALGMDPIVLAAESAARHEYFHALPTSTHVSSRR
jgi:hypothetical protein